MLKIGITGGIGSGKSIVCRVFEQFGVPVFYSDQVSKLLFREPEIIRKIYKTFGRRIFDLGTVNTYRLSKVVFKNKTKLDELNAILHPEVFRLFDDWMQIHSNKKYVIKEAAILFESGANKFVDAVLSVSAPVETRIQRVKQRDGLDRRSIQARIDRQWSDEERNQKSEFVIYNDDSQMILPQIMSLHERFNLGDLSANK